MKRACFRILSILLCMICLAALCPAAPAENAWYSPQNVYDYALVSDTASLNLRTGPGTEYPWIGAVNRGCWVGVTGEYGSWYSVYLPDTGLSGYMSKNYLRLSGGGSMPGAATGVVSNPLPHQFLNLRAAPSYSAQVLGIFYNGAVFSLLSSGADGWYFVQIDGMTGYFRREYVRLTGAEGTGAATVRSANGGSVNLRSAPTYTGSAVIGRLAPGTQVTVLLSSPLAGSFWKIASGSLTGYMDSTFLTQAVSPVPSVKPSSPAAQGTATVKNPGASQYLNLRAQPSTSAKVIARYKNGVRFEVLQAGETWTKVYGSASGKVGYFLTKYLKLSGVSTQKTVSNGSSYVNLRSAASKDQGKIYTRVPSGASVTVLVPGDEWCKVRYGGTTGYMMTRFLK